MALTRVTVPGTLLQVVQATETARVSQTSSSTNNFTSALMSASITPSASSSKILIIVSGTIGWSVGTLHTKVLRGSTDIFRGASNGSRLQSANSHRLIASTYNLTMDSINIHYLDSPSTTSATTYNFVGSLGSTYDGTIILNGTSDNSDADYGGAAASSITLMEIAG
jgi:hypothetical protein